MKAKPIPSQNKLREMLDYDAETGILIWKPRPLSDFKNVHGFRTWNSQNAGKRAGSVSHKKRPRREISIDGVRYREHRVIWKLATGEEPGEDIDHEDGDGTNNRLKNIRSVTHQINLKNRAKSSKNTSGFVGISWDSVWRKWVAKIGDGQHIGAYSSINEAVAARKAAEFELGYHPNHGRDLKYV